MRKKRRTRSPTRTLPGKVDDAEEEKQKRTAEDDNDEMPECGRDLDDEFRMARTERYEKMLTTSQSRR